MTKSERDDLRAVQTNQDEAIAKAKKYLQLAEDIGARKNNRLSRKHRNEYLHNVPHFYTKQEIQFTILAAESFRVCGEDHWYDSSKAYAHAAALQADVLQNVKLSAELFTEAGIVMEKVDSNFANEYYRKAVTQHCDSSQYVCAAMLQERMAITYDKKRDLNAAIEEYQRAAKLYSAAKMRDHSDRMLDRAAYIMGTSGKLKEAAIAYQSLALGQAHQSLKKFNVPQLMLRGSVLLLQEISSKSSESVIEETIGFVRSIYSSDCRFAESCEHDFIVDLVECIRLRDPHTLADCLYSFNNISSELNELLLSGLEELMAAISKKEKI